MIQFKNVSKVYENGTKALSNVNFTINSGEFVFLVGASGAGKTTAVKLILREILPTQGEIIVNGRDITKLKKKEIPYYRRNLGVVFQDFRLLPDKTVYENVAFAMEIVEARERDIRRQVPSVLSMVGLASKAESYPHQLSGGEQQRATLARAIVNNPSILIADEPTGNLDPDTAMDIMRLINMINHRGTTVIMATHASEIVDAMKKRVITFKKGIVVRDEEKGGYANEASNI
ncbi:MAG: cell division ATP-binding protein FtsE [Caldicoprobacterales bacterium]|nr:cell division ATP-binding protein FtsE [Clostridiales bacterium]